MNGQSGAQNNILMGDVLSLAPQSNVLEGDVLTRLKAAWLQTAASDVAQKGTFGVVQDLTAILPDSDGFNNDLRLQVAEEIINLLNRLGIQGHPAQAAPPHTVQIERNYDEMSLRQLLEAVIRNPLEYPMAVRYIRAHRDTPRVREWVLMDGHGGIDLDATFRYVVLLNKPHGQQQRFFENRRPVSLDCAMGVDDQPQIHPITGRLVQGPDSNGFDWSTLDRELRESVIWARKVNHNLLPDLESDVYGWSEQLFSQPLPKRFQDILADYRNARIKRHSSVDGIRTDWPEDLPHDRVYAFSVTVAVPVINYEALVREAANMAGSLVRSGMGVTIKGGVYRTITVSGMSPFLDGVVVIEGGDISGMSPSGVLYMPPGKTIRQSGMSPNIQVINQSWEQLAIRLRLV